MNLTRTIAIFVLTILYYTCPILAIGSIFYPAFASASAWWSMLFWPFGLTGLFASGALKQLRQP